MSIIIKKEESQFTMIDWWKRAFIENYTNFEGRSRRSEYWYFMLFNLLIIIGLAIIIGLSAATFGDSIDSFGFIFMIPLIIFMLALIIPSIAVSVRRLHDTGKSGWWYLLGVIPIVSYIGSIVLLVYYCTDSETGSNKWGPNPKELIDLKEIDEIGKF